MNMYDVVNISQYIIEEWLDVVITRIEWFEKILETEMLLLNA
ncbi:hypothetical protein SGLAD_v1c01550 [Spiroplasma gladiatoris]|uniref:Uncharacterized protein n=1 Tax=Spiroplasma gladiatoris TaxID=2143 RepID=A0A4P7AG84_9MOLU|nr:hypothetical protein SGLAD_v1c01550 [Spiroplasma gladiatoris]